MSDVGYVPVYTEEEEEELRQQGRTIAPDVCPQTPDAHLLMVVCNTRLKDRNR